MSRSPVPAPVEDPPQEECPKCPPVGSPAWMATFADIATLLMAFFVLILSFAEFNQPKFKMVAGSLKKSFGVQREVPVVEQPLGTTVLKLDFSPSPEPAITQELRQDTTQIEQPKIRTTDQDTPEQQAARELAEAIQEAVQQGQIQVETQDGQVVMTFDQDTPEPLSQKLAQASEALQQAQQATGLPTDDVALKGLTGDLSELAEASRQQAERAETQITEGKAERSAALAEAQLRVALRREVSQGLVTVEQREDRVFVTIGAGGAFPSGDADLTEEARDVMSRLAFAAMNEASNIVVTGHTDSVPLSAASAYRDNWGLAAARASSVVRELSGTGLIAADRLTAISRGETMPVDDNTTAQGREQNRRIEIEITY